VTPPIEPPTVHLAFSPDAAYVRTVRLVAAAVARRAGVPDEALDEVRLAIGEACSRAVALHRRYGLADLIDVTMIDGGRFTVRVTDRSPAEQVRVRTDLDPDAPEAAEEELAAGVGLALLTALVSDLSVAGVEGGKGTQVCMSWPVNRRPGS
jgi:anti-sigma regulatory factor (Ser/Thr protein kinase)